MPEIKRVETFDGLVHPARRGLWLGLLVGAQVLYVLGVAGAGYATTAFGRHVILLTQPTDVRQLRRSEYVNLRYAISEVPLASWHSAEEPQLRQQVHVLLAPGPDSLATVVGVYTTAPQPTTNQAVLRGWVSEVYQHSFALRYNLERYYVPEESLLRRQKAFLSPPLRVRVSIAPWGQARIETVRE